MKKLPLPDDSPFARSSSLLCVVWKLIRAGTAETQHWPLRTAHPLTLAECKRSLDRVHCHLPCPAHAGRSLRCERKCTARAKREVARPRGHKGTGEAAFDVGCVPVLVRRQVSVLIPHAMRSPTATRRPRRCFTMAASTSIHGQLLVGQLSGLGVLAI